MINYYLLTKPKIILGNLVPFIAGFFLASGKTINYSLFFETLIGLGFIIASACVFNNIINKEMDSKMQRTRSRAIPSGRISSSSAFLFGSLLAVFGGSILFIFSNTLALLTAFFGFFIYVVVYSILKRHTIYAAAIGSISGAIPPIVGYAAASGRLDMGAFLLFLMLAFWQMPHFYAIAAYNYSDYKAAKIPLLPMIKGMHRTKIHMTFYIVGFIIASFLLTYFNYTGYTYLAVALGISLLWLSLCLSGFQYQNDHVWGRRMFHFSLVVILSICFVIPFDTV